jgi:zinc protease
MSKSSHGGLPNLFNQLYIFELILPRGTTMRALLFGLMLVLGLGAPAAARAAQPANAGATLKVPPLRYHYRELANGLKVYAMPDPNTANVAIQVWYRVGSKDDPKGRSGFAHLFEHMLFKATRNMPEGLFFKMTSDVGADYNASTHADYTDYYEVAPANHLQRLLWAEAERMGSLVVDPAALESETDVVKEELRQRVLASPYGRLFYLYLPQANFAVHPYGRPGIGSIEDLESSTIDDVRAFHATYYRPDNAIMVVAGNFDLVLFNRWVDQYFAPIARPSRPIPRVTAVEPPRTAPRTLTAFAPNVPLPAVAANYLHPAASSADIPALFAIDAILQRGRSSRLNRALVHDQRVAAQVFTNFETRQDSSAYSVIAILSAGKTAEQGEAALLAELARLRDGAVTQAELDEAKNEIVTATLQNRETAQGRSAELADSVLTYRDPQAADRILAAIQALTPAAVQRVARTLFADNNRVVIRYKPEEGRAAGETGDTIATAPTIAAAALAVPAGVAVHALAPEGQRVSPPDPAAPVAVRIAALSERRLANGLRVIVAPKPGVPLVSADLRAAAGTAADPAGRNGTAAITADLLDAGTRSRGATEIAAAIESLGASLSTGSGADFSQASLQARSDRADPAFAILADVVRNPVFAEEELARSRQQSLDGLTVALRQPGGIAAMALSRALYGEAPYGGLVSPATLGAITRADVAAFHAAYWRPDNAVLVITGDIEAEDGFALAERHFGGWARPSGPPPARPDAGASASAARTIVVDLPGTGQAAVQMGVRGISRRDPAWFDLLLANEVLGGDSTARLNVEIREKRGLSYGAYSGMPQRAAPGPIIASTQTRNDAAVQVVGLMEDELRRLREAPPTQTELDARKAGLIGGFGRSVETGLGLAAQISTRALFGLPPEGIGAYAADVGRVTPESAQRAAAAYFDPAKTDLVVVGDAKLFFDALKEKRPQAERIPVSELNLDREALR